MAAKKKKSKSTPRERNGARYHLRPIEATGAGQMGILGGTGVSTGAWG